MVDLGARTRDFSFPIIKLVTEGIVLASETHPNIPRGSVDLVLLIDAYYEFFLPREFMDGVVKGLEPGSRGVLVEYRGEDRTVPVKRLHKMTQEQARKEMATVGLQWLRTDHYLPQQHVMIFTTP
ncbi:MAG: hypothetical protein ACI9DH_000374 [Halioglobus sp.]